MSVIRHAINDQECDIKWLNNAIFSHYHIFMYRL